MEKEMEKEIKVGMNCKQVKAIEEYNFDYVGEEFEITEVTDKVIKFKGRMGIGGVSKEEFDTYFEIVEDENIIKEINNPISMNIGDKIIYNKDLYEVVGGTNLIKNFKVDSKVKIINGVFKGIEGTISKIFNNLNKCCICVNDENENLLTIDKSDLELIKIPKPKNENFEDTLKFMGETYSYKVKIRGFRTTVKLLSLKTKGSVYYNSNDVKKYNREEGIYRAFKKAVVNQLIKEIKS